MNPKYIYIFNKETDELIETVNTPLRAYRFRYNILSKEGIETYTKKPRKVKSENKNRDEQCEHLWRKILLFDANYKCEYSGLFGKLDVHHILTRSIKHLRWSLENGIVLNSRWHVLDSDFSAHKTPIKFKKWLNKYKGKGYYEKLLFKSRLPQKTDLKLTLIYLKQEAKRRGIL